MPHAPRGSTHSSTNGAQTSRNYAEADQLPQPIAKRWVGNYRRALLDHVIILTNVTFRPKKERYI